MAFDREGLGDVGGMRRVDVVFCLDSTGSMGNCIEAMQEIISAVAEIYSGFRIQTRFGLIEFRNRLRCERTRGNEIVHVAGTKVQITPHGEKLHTLHRHLFNVPGYVPGSHFTLDTDTFRELTHTISAKGGGHFYESINDALYLAARSEWEDEGGTSRTIILITDSRPQEPDFDVESTADLAGIFTENGIDQFYTISKKRYFDDYDPILDSKTRKGDDITTALLPIDPMDVDHIKEQFKAIAEHSGYSISESIPLMNENLNDVTTKDYNVAIGNDELTIEHPERRTDDVVITTDSRRTREDTQDDDESSMPWNFVFGMIFLALILSMNLL